MRNKSTMGKIRFARGFIGEKRCFYLTEIVYYNANMCPVGQ